MTLRGVQGRGARAGGAVADLGSSAVGFGALRNAGGRGQPTEGSGKLARGLVALGRVERGGVLDGHAPGLGHGRVGEGALAV